MTTWTDRANTTATTWTTDTEIGGDDLTYDEDLEYDAFEFYDGTGTLTTTWSEADEPTTTWTEDVSGD